MKINQGSARMHRGGLKPTSVVWSHLSDLPDSLRSALKAEIERFEAEDEVVLQAAAAAIRQARLSMRVPTMCKVLRSAHPELPKRKVFMAVALVTGISEGHVRDLFYSERKKP